MAARRTINAINWSAIAERLAEVDKPIFASFRSKSDGYLRRMNEFPEKVPAIDWATYKKSIPKGSLVDEFQKQYEALKIPVPADNYTSIVEGQEKEAMEHVRNFITESNRRIESYKAEIEKIGKMLPFEQMTMEDFAETYPEVAWSPEKPTIWPHFPEWQPGDEPEPIPKAEH
ncbi:ATP synthase subunit d, mitochondrial [Microplitis demolitor]|uniref:ATP synthase subunit d, mitochondrial n=1 Tax=Microplitis demolitor TaxID=69319 RepID=UPI0004CCE82B|nr:ATP synthase subunit d, mitochondrial [Microplitis demolitor]